jgi:glutathione S-transferase
MKLYYVPKTRANRPRWARRPTLLAEGFSVADIVVTACLLWAKSLGALDDSSAAVREYTARMGDRPARRRAAAD